MREFMTSDTVRLVVIGAGLQGASVALALAERGVRVCLLERRAAPLAAASRGNEGKIHLGFVYALDRSGRTGRRMIEAALCFGPLLDRWCGPLPWESWRSAGFQYVVMPDSLARAAELEEAYGRLRAWIPEASALMRFAPQYAGRPLDWFWRRSDLQAARPRIPGAAPCDVLATEEVSVDTRALCDVVAARLARHPLIELRCGVRVEGAERRPNGFRLHLETAAGSSALDAQTVVNCAWIDRARIDRSLGLREERALSYRVKHRALVRPRGDSRAIAPVTMVQGPYGDVVPLVDGLVYISWYPECRRYFGAVPPEREEADTAECFAVASRSLAVLSDLYPALRGAEIVTASPCIIVAPGETDVDDPASALHERNRFGPREHDGWWTVDTGKLTAAPLNGEVTAARITGEVRHVAV